MRYKSLKTLFFLWSIALISCDDGGETRQRPFPLIRTLSVSNIDKTGVQFNGEIIRDGTDPVIDFGFMWAVDKSLMPGPDTFLISLGSDLRKEFSVKVSNRLIATRKYEVMAYAATAHYTVYGEVEKFVSQVTSPTRITSFSPPTVLDGDSLTIFGENFNEYGERVIINQTQAVVLSRDRKALQVKVPAVSQAGPAIVLVDALFAKATSDKLIILSPSIASFSPSSGAAGALVTLTGRFSLNSSYNKVFFNGTLSQLVSSSKDVLIVSVPSGLSGGASITIDVNGKAFTTGTFTIE